MTPTSPKRSLAALVIAALALTAVAAPAAGARPDQRGQDSAGSQSAPAREGFVPGGPDGGLYCGKDYGQNSATGDYCVRLKATSSAPQQIAPKNDGFSWGDARAGSGAALALLIAVAGSTAVLRRRRAALAARRHRATATT